MLGARMATIEIDLPPKGYAVRIEPGALAALGELTRACAPASQCVVIADRSVARLHGEAARRSLEAAGFAVSIERVDGEDHKNLETVARLYDALVSHGAERGSPVIAFGGGVAGDTAGFVAATYLRGVPFIQCPTTLLAMVDASVGGKVGVNLPQGKNLVGAFQQARVVVFDGELLRTLPLRELAAGFAECIKHAVIADASLFDWIEREAPRLRALDAERMVELIRRNVEIKASVVMQDERESGIRAHLNLGHTFGHALEAACGYGTLLHGEAVGLGLLAASRLAEQLGLCDAALRKRLERLLPAVGLPIRFGLPPLGALRSAMKVDKKVSGSRIRFVLPQRIGAVCLRDDVPPERVDAAWDAIREGA
jgi:3-dehydroquinate synthase